MKCSEQPKLPLIRRRANDHLSAGLSHDGLFSEFVTMPKYVFATLIAYLLCCFPALLLADDIDATVSQDYRAYIVSPADGETVSSPVRVIFGLSNPLGVAPAGVQKENTGHHHLIIDRPLPPLDQPVPNDEHHRHFGGGQTEVEITLTPGEHTLQLLLGDFVHIPHDPPVMSKQIKITVE